MQNNKRVDLINWGLVGIFIFITVMMKAGLLPNNPLIQFIPMFIFAWVHGIKQYGGKLMVAWFAITWVVSNFFEGLSITMGFPFGNYHYNYSGVPQIWHVPILIMVSYFAIVYTCWEIGLILTNHTERPITGIDKVAVPVVAAMVMTMWDLVSDPASSTIGKNWIWENGGSFYGVPISNFLGWVFVVYVFLQIFTLIITRRDIAPKLTLPQSQGYKLQPVVIYLMIGIGTIADGVTATSHIALFQSAGLIALFTMIFVSMICFMRLKESKNKD